jgi:hypothetical protein
MSFVRPELADRFRRWREPLLWGALVVVGLWLVWRGYASLDLLRLALGLIFTAAGAALLRGAIGRLRLRGDSLDAGLVVVDEGQIAYLGPSRGGVVDLPSVVRVEIVTRPHVPPDSGHAWVITTEDGSRLTIPLGARGAESLFDALSPLPGIDFDAGAAAVAARGAGRATLWKKAG